MIIDFNEIPSSNRGGTRQDTFELFSRDFIESMGYEIVEEPSRGADGGIDFKVLEIRQTHFGTKNVFWLASCKHYSHSGVAINTEIENNILDRVISNGCDGFMGIYSTIPSSGLINILNGLANKGRIEVKTFDHEKIEGAIVGITKREQLFIRYFPNSYKNWKDLYYFFEPIKLFESYIDSNLEEIHKEVLLVIFGNIATAIKSIRAHKTLSEAANSLNFNIINDSKFGSYNHRRDLEYLKRYRPFHLGRKQKKVESFLCKPNYWPLTSYFNGYDSGIERIDSIRQFMIEKVFFRYGIRLAENSCRNVYFDVMKGSWMHVFTSTLIVGDGHYEYLNQLFVELKTQLT